MSHELRTPLSAMLGFAECLRDGLAGRLNSEQRRFATLVVEGGQHMLQVINDVLDLAKLEAGSMRLNPKPLALNTFLISGVEFFSHRALSRGVRIRFQGLPNKADVLIVDEQKLRQILYNLISNAVKFAYKDSILDISLCCVSRDEINPQNWAGDIPACILPLPENPASEFIEFRIKNLGDGIDLTPELVPLSR